MTFPDDDVTGDNPEQERLQALHARLEVRSRVLQAIRSFFHEHQFIEVDTPVRLPCPALELHIDAEPSGDAFLRTSPELHMKRLLASGMERIFQLGPCFRQGERGRLHHPEYTMLEWYRVGADYIDILADTRRLMAFVAREVLGSGDLVRGDRKIALDSGWHLVSISDAFLEFAGWDPVKAYDPDRFDRDLVEEVEPNLPTDAPVVLKDYPAEAAALSRRKKDRPEVAERWELYVDGLELANAYSELTDAGEQRARFEACVGQRRELGREVYPLDQDFLQALESGLPSCGGIALGVDRLVMLLSGADSLDEVIAFRE
jgi:lysyl-tRNA synthetase class 2